MEILSVRSEKNIIAPGVYALEAEIKIWDDAANDYRYLDYCIYEGEHFSVAAQSIMDYMLNDASSEDDIVMLENYDSLADAMVSKYIDGFILAHQIVNEMIDITFGHRKSIYNYIVSPIEFENGKEENVLEESLIATFMYQPNVNTKAVQRKAVVRTSDSFVSVCCMYDEDDQVVETFEDADAAAKSKWYLLYQNMIERMNAQTL